MNKFIGITYFESNFCPKNENVEFVLIFKKMKCEWHRKS